MGASDMCLRLGIVTDVDDAKRKARVKFHDENRSSHWLSVIASPPFIPGRGSQHTGTASGGSGYAAFELHDHPQTITPWMPSVGDTVLTAFLPVPQGDGFVLGSV